MTDKNNPLPLFSQHYPTGSDAFSTLVNTHVKNALEEDIGSGDLTASLIEADHEAQATIISREPAVISGIDWATACFHQVDQNIRIAWHVKDGDVVNPNQTLCEISGNARGLLTAERSALNFLQTLSAVATQTRIYVEAIAGTSAKILDTRKTLPGLRMAEKYAVSVGGGHNQRLALYDGILIKENHIAAAGSIAAALQQAQALNTPASIQIEVESLDELKQSLDAGANSVLLDDFSLAALKEAVKLNTEQYQKQALLEASGNVNLTTVRDIAETGVDRISIGALTKNIQAIDLSMRIK